MIKDRVYHAEVQARYVERQKETDREAYLAKRMEIQRRWRDANRDKVNAHQKVNRAIKRGILTRPEACGRCGKECRPEASHDDYSKPLEVEWLCRQCHAQKDFPA